MGQATAELYSAKISKGQRLVSGFRLRIGADEVLQGEDSGHDYLMDPGCRAVGRPPCTRPGLGLSSPEGTTGADVSPQQREPRHS